MKNANGYGSITKLKGNRRKPYMVRITVGRDENGFPIRKVLGDTTRQKLMPWRLSPTITESLMILQVGN